MEIHIEIKLLKLNKFKLKHILIKDDHIYLIYLFQPEYHVEDPRKFLHTQVVYVDLQVSKHEEL